ncbi:hypothetical protein C7974DRAFT_458781 [Boeremia exigua]|uniref:uncharacterized protein n=1 Tax=Boeremia exigua TaxID=749465 RepID=UPI001E8E86FB|nr:uncharacterized protein C7974DRAFT_458781 [Boeremia exigua]KAH6620538.1 hypothetical protein C7974DRAFT_458781 [Boeremia exigua]
MDSDNDYYNDYDFDFGDSINEGIPFDSLASFASSSSRPEPRLHRSLPVDDKKSESGIDHNGDQLFQFDHNGDQLSQSNDNDDRLSQSDGFSASSDPDKPNFTVETHPMIFELASETSYRELQQSIGHLSSSVDNLSQPSGAEIENGVCAYNLSVVQVNINNIERLIKKYNASRAEEEAFEASEKFEADAVTLPMPKSAESQWRIVSAYRDARFVLVVPAWKIGAKRTQGSQTVRAGHMVPTGSIVKGSGNDAWNAGLVAWLCKTEHLFGYGAGFDVYISSAKSSCPYCLTSRKDSNGIDQDFILPDGVNFLLQLSSHVELNTNWDIVWNDRTKTSRARVDGQPVVFTKGSLVHNRIREIPDKFIIGPKASSG